MKQITSLMFCLLLSSASVALAANDGLPGVVWTSTQVKGGTLGPPLGLSISSDEGHYEYEALEQGADKPLQPEPISAARMQGRNPMIAILIDDMGMDRAHSARAMKLPPAVTFAYLPYSPELPAQTAEAQVAGHELILHMPMQPERKTANPGPDYLGAGMSPLALLDRVTKNLDAFDGYVGVNNHMGSKFTKDRDALNVVMGALAERGLMFLDSRTVPGSIAEKVAKEHGLQAAHRDVFLDNKVDPSAVLQSLMETEQVARRTGTAIAIGHPKDVTLSALEKWIPTLAAKGFTLVPLSQVIALRNGPKPLVAKVEPAPVPAPNAEEKIEAKSEVKKEEPFVAPPLPVVEVSAPLMPPESPLAAAIVATPAPVHTPASEPVATVTPAPAAPAKKPYMDSVAKAEAKAKEWAERNTP